MKLIPWNCLGLGQPLEARALRDIVKMVDLMGIFLMETKIDCSFVACVMKKIRFSFFFFFLFLRLVDVVV